MSEDGRPGQDALAKFTAASEAAVAQLARAQAREFALGAVAALAEGDDSRACEMLREALEMLDEGDGT